MYKQYLICINCSYDNSLKLFCCNLKEFVVVILYAPFEEKYFLCVNVPDISFFAV